MGHHFWISLTLAACLGMMGCGGGTQVTDTWTRPNYQPAPVERIAVFGLTEDRLAREVFEDHVSAELRDRGITAIAGRLVLPEDIAKENREVIEQRLAAHGVDAALTLRLARDEASIKRVANVSAPGRYSAGIGFHDYYGGWNSMRRSTVKSSHKLWIESNFYTLNHKGVTWQGIIETENPKQIDKFADEYATVLVKELLKEPVIRTTGK